VLEGLADKLAVEVDTQADTAQLQKVPVVERVPDNLAVADIS
jgi:hypothetical protein